MAPFKVDKNNRETNKLCYCNTKNKTVVTKASSSLLRNSHTALEMP
jgi:hypothetical protein